MEAHVDINTNTREIPKANTKKIWQTFWILLGLTTLEFAIAFLMPESLSTLKLWIFILMTIVKAFYIIAEFMHLKHEMKTLIWSILLPTVFVIWLIIALLVEGGSH